MMISRRVTPVAAVLSLALFAALQATAGPPGGDYTVTKLVSDIPGAAPVIDPDLVNGWGLARSGMSPWWVADNGPDPKASKSTLYNQSGTKQALTVDVLGGPTGAVFAGLAGNFPIATTASTTLGPASFIFATEAGDIRAWRGGSNAASSLPRRASPPTPSSRGFALAADAGQPSALRDGLPQCAGRRVRRRLEHVTPGCVRRPDDAGRLRPVRDPDHRSNLFVTYAKQDADADDEVDGQSLGFVDEYDLRGEPGRARGAARAAERAVGHGDGAGVVRRSAGVCSSATSATVRSTRTGAATAAGTTTVRCAHATAASS